MQVLSCWQCHVHNLQVHKVFLQKFSFIWHQKVAMNFPNRISILLWKVIFLICKREVLSLVLSAAFPFPNPNKPHLMRQAKQNSSLSFTSQIHCIPLNLFLPIAILLVVALRVGFSGSSTHVFPSISSRASQNFFSDSRAARNWL